MRFSASKVKAWTGCSLAAHYRYDDSLPRSESGAAVFGTVIHHALQVYIDSCGDHPRAKNDFLTLWAYPDRIGKKIDYYPQRTSWGGYRKKGIDILDALHAQRRLRNTTTVGTEIEFLVPFGEHELYGFIDLLEIEKSGTGIEILKIIDWKSSGTTPTAVELAVDVQFTVYHWAVNQREFWCGMPDDPRFTGLPNGEWLWETVGRDMSKRCIWYHLNSQKEIDAGPRSDLDYQRLYRVCDEIQRASAAEIYVPKVGAACLHCDYQAQCALEIPAAVAALADADDPTRWI